MLISVIIDLVAVTLLTFVLYYRRHRRKDLIAAYLGINIGVLAVTLALSQTQVAAGLGLGLFGILSIIRLRSVELSQNEIAYYFSALALGIIGGLSLNNLYVTAGLMALIIIAVTVGDHPRLFAKTFSQQIVLDKAITNESELKLYLTSVLNAEIQSANVLKLDMVNDSTVVDVRFRPYPALKAEVTQKVTV